MTSPADPWVRVAHLLRPQGRHGEVLADLLTDFPDSLRGRADLLLVPAQPPGAPPRPITLLSHWLPSGRNQGRVVLKLSGVDSISAAEQLAGADLVVPAGSRVTLPEGSFYVSDLIGLEVLDRGVSVGRVEDVTFPLSPDGRRRLPDGAPLLIIRRPEGPEAEIPFVEAFITRIDTETGTIAMKLPDGLLDLNADDSAEEPDPSANSSEPAR